MTDVEHSIRDEARQILARRPKPSDLARRCVEAYNQYYYITISSHGDIDGRYYILKEAYRLAAKLMGLRV